MRQVPVNYIIIGRGRLASHLANYLKLADVPYTSWARDQEPQELKKQSLTATRILLAINDDAIVPFIKEHNLPTDKTIHFSGTLSTKLAIRLHPLMTFTRDMYSLSDYKKIPFVGEEDQPPLSVLIPELSNPYYSIPKNSEDLYHALCVISGNGTVVLWQAVFKAFEEKLKLPKEVLLPYLERVSRNLIQDSDRALTGPWVREDIKTIEKNQKSLSGTDLQLLYLSLFNTFNSPRADSAGELRSSL